MVKIFALCAFSAVKNGFRSSLGGRTRLLRDNAVRSDGEGYNDVVINHEQDAVAVGDVEVENLVAMPGDTFEFMAMEGMMPPVAAEQGEFGASGFCISSGRLVNSHLKRRSRRKIIGL